MATQHSLVLGIVSGAYERLREEDSFQAGLYVALAAAVGILVAVILYFTCYTGILKRENERLGKVLGSLKREKETLGKEKEALQKNYEILKSKNERLGKEDSSKVGFCVVVVVGILVAVILWCAYYIACFKRDIKRLTREKEDLQKNYDSLKGKNERLGKEKEDLQKQNVLGIVSGENERLGKGDSFEAGLYFAFAAAVGILLLVILYFACYTGILKRENERLGKEKKALQKNYEILKSKNERLGKEKEDLQKKYETLKQEKEKVEADFKELLRNTNMCVYAVDRDWKKLIEVCVKVTLDPDTASPCLTVSEDGSRVRFTGEGSAEWPSVLGREGFTSGGHYWEVEVGEKGYWVLGVSTHPHEKSIPEKPGEGYWLVRLVKGKTCKAVSQSVDQTLNLEKMCKMWGVYLDHGGGRLSFYNAETRFHIHTLEGSFPGQVYPIFSPGSHDKGPLIINTKVKNV
ncbi:E3 ubiquitin-protein ligase TRIM39-like isoform X10 [Acipenser ruthenus]|uniref:E3 ubiquitin-protein ligase TRIM39-like isoform X10 n=1 Tax=Acipenser ruthenus TaxID=7906 RepID=UPI0027422916|nr:E3 ubiquitin-protein ligase TRIM39-like isoform X10 [Acipenser ruthenus]